SYEATGDGEDTIEGNGGRDTIFGGLGQDDITGGSSSFFSLTTPDKRPDSADLIYGGSGLRTVRDDDSTFASAGLTHARDADTIAGGNANIVRTGGLTGVDVAGGKDLTLARPPRYGT